MTRKFVVSVIISLIFAAAAHTAEPPPYSQLDVRPFDPSIDPDIDMFISHWNEATPHQIYGGLIERTIFTKCGGDPMHPPTRGAVLEFINRLSHAKLQKHKVTTPTILKEEQIILYIDSGEGVIEAGNKTERLRSGVGVFVPAGLEFTMRNTGDEALTMYLISEPVPDGFNPIGEILVKDENTMSIGTTKSHWSHILRVFFYGDEAKRAFTTITGMCPVWFDPLTMGQPHSHKTGDEEVWFLVEGEIVLMLGKELRRITPGTAYKIPPNGTTPHSNINVSEKDAKMVWFMKHTPEP